MAKEGKSLGSVGWIQNDGAIPDATEVGSLGFVEAVEAGAASPGSTGATALFTDGYFEYTDIDQSNEVMGSFGVFRGTVSAAAVEIIAHVAYMAARKKAMDAQHIPGLI
jgi:hypothetical protein